MVLRFLPPDTALCHCSALLEGREAVPVKQKRTELKFCAVKAFYPRQMT